MMIDRDVRIELSDGVELAGTLYRPDTSTLVPTVLLYSPYRKDDMIAAADEPQLQYFVEHGYAALHVDMRGCGASGGARWPSFDGPREGADGAEVVEWAAAQSWCDGNVGMFGLSYPGLTSLQTAMMRPPHLRAIAPIMPPIDARNMLYPSDVPTPFLTSTWANFMFALELMPPGRQDPEGTWHQTWLERLDRFGERSREWRAHPHRNDPFWGDCLVDPTRINVPTFMIGGWRDLFPREVVDFFAGLEVPRKLMMGPWEHFYPTNSPTVATDHLELIRRWFDQWVKGVGPAEDENDAPVNFWVMGAERWRAAQTWPVAEVEDLVLYAGSDRHLVQERGLARPGEVGFAGDLTVGAQSNLLDGLASGWAGPLDQGPDEVDSVVFDGPDLSEPLELTGEASAALWVALDEGDELNLTLKLSHVAPNGRSSLITTGSARAITSDGDGTLVTPQVMAQLSISFVPIAYEVPAGHRLRLSVATSDFPRHWPSAVAPSIRLGCGDDLPFVLTVPVLPSGPWDSPAIPVPAEDMDPEPLIVEGYANRRVERSLSDQRVTTTIDFASTSLLPAGDGVLKWKSEFVFAVDAARPDQAHAICVTEITMSLSGGSSVTATANSRQTRETLLGHATVEVDGTKLLDRSFLT